MCKLSDQSFSVQFVLMLNYMKYSPHVSSLVQVSCKHLNSTGSQPHRKSPCVAMVIWPRSSSAPLGSPRFIFIPPLTGTERDENRIPRLRVRTDCTERTGRQSGPGLGPDQDSERTGISALLLRFQSGQALDSHRAVRRSTAELGWTPGGCSCTCALLTGGGLIWELLQSPRHVPGPGESPPVSTCLYLSRHDAQTIRT